MVNPILVEHENWKQQDAHPV
ncbi:uncharacterized protein FFNC_15687 [Fusarium fujikuroi]|nr:uncharacterized protein FFNC_15687 [Fusarium fujikuroi]